MMYDLQQVLVVNFLENCDPEGLYSNEILLVVSLGLCFLSSTL